MSFLDGVLASRAVRNVVCTGGIATEMPSMVLAAGMNGEMSNCTSGNAVAAEASLIGIQANSSISDNAARAPVTTPAALRTVRRGTGLFIKFGPLVACACFLGWDSGQRDTGSGLAVCDTPTSALEGQHATTPWPWLAGGFMR